MTSVRHIRSSDVGGVGDGGELNIGKRCVIRVAQRLEITRG